VEETVNLAGGLTRRALRKLPVSAIDNGRNSPAIRRLAFIFAIRSLTSLSDQEMPENPKSTRRDTNFRHATKRFMEESNIELWNKHWGILSEEYRIGFTDAIFLPHQVRSNFWIKPDAAWSQSEFDENGSLPLIILEHCGSWQNFYQKRFTYNGCCLSLFSKKENRRSYEWSKSRLIQIQCIYYFLPDDDHIRRTVRVMPNFEHERFLFTYSEWSCPNRELKLRELENARSRKDIVDDFKSKQGALP
jgi:hypothetical protein